jgi:hypothetical protein
LVEALNSTFRIVENCLDGWTLDTLDEEIGRRWETGEEWGLHPWLGDPAGVRPRRAPLRRAERDARDPRLPLVDFWD